MRPRIGITLTRDAALRPGRVTWFADDAYGAAVQAAGGRARLLAGGEPPEVALADVDGLVIPGGDDFLPPAPYPPDVKFRPADEAQIAADLALVRAALARGVPLLGICYGMQLLALARGGALVYDLARDVPGAAPHRLAAGERHAISLAAGSRLSALFDGAREIAVNSRHHQGVAAPGEGLAASARGADGVIEAIEAPPGRPFALGVQWHPEDLDADHVARVYGGLVAAARARS